MYSPPPPLSCIVLHGPVWYGIVYLVLCSPFLFCTFFVWACIVLYCHVSILRYCMVLKSYIIYCLVWSFLVLFWPVWSCTVLYVLPKMVLSISFCQHCCHAAPLFPALGLVTTSRVRTSQVRTGQVRTGQVRTQQFF